MNEPQLINDWSATFSLSVFPAAKYLEIMHKEPEKKSHKNTYKVTYMTLSQIGRMNEFSEEKYYGNKEKHKVI